MTDQTADRPKRLISIGECMVELSGAPGGLLRMGFAGDTFNTAWYLRRELGPDWQIAYLSAVGTDETSAAMLGFMQEGGIDTHLVRQLAGRMPGLYLIHLDGAERRFSYWRDTSAAKSLADDDAHLEQAFAEGDAFYFSGITLAILPEAWTPTAAAAPRRRQGRRQAGRLRPQHPAAALAGRLGDAARHRGGGRRRQHLPAELSRRARGLRRRDPAASAARYLELGANEVVVKNGGDPAIIAIPGHSEVIPAPAVGDAVDTTGAGDSFGAAYVAARLSGASPADAMHRGHRLAGEVVRHYGALIR